MKGGALVTIPHREEGLIIHQGYNGLLKGMTGYHDIDSLEKQANFSAARTKHF